MKKKNTKLLILLTLLLFHFTSEGFLQIDTKSKCPNGPLTPLGLLISLGETEDEENGEQYASKLNEAERKVYKDMVDLKRSFAATMNYIPQNFSPEKQSYWDGLSYFLLVFVIIAFFPFIFIVFYLILRFLCKKCSGPKKISEVNKQYRNLTWAILISSSIAGIVLLSIVLAKSSSVSNGIETTFNAAAAKIASNDDLYEKINNVVAKFRSKNLNVPDTTYMEKFKQLIETYISNTKSRTNQILDDESTRQALMIIVFVIIIILIILAFLFFILKLEKMECILSVIMFLTLPLLIIFEGYNAKFFFYYGDLCDTVYGFMYENEVPVADQALGYYYNCFPRDTKAELYNIRYRLFATKDYATTQDDQNELSTLYENLNTQTLESLFNCTIVWEVVPKIESDFCKTSLENIYDLLLLLTWVLLCALLFSIGTRRLEVLIWKRRNEIESMIGNQEVMF